MQTIETRFRKKLERRLLEMIEEHRDTMERGTLSPGVDYLILVGQCRALRIVLEVAEDVEAEMTKEG